MDRIIEHLHNPDASLLGHNRQHWLASQPYVHYPFAERCSSGERFPCAFPLFMQVPANQSWNISNHTQLMTSAISHMVWLINVNYHMLTKNTFQKQSTGWNGSADIKEWAKSFQTMIIFLKKIVCTQFTSQGYFHTKRGKRTQFGKHFISKNR